MPAGVLSAKAKRFVAEHVHSLAQLELLLLLHRDPAEQWTPAAAAAEMRFPDAWVRTELMELCRIGVAAYEEDGEERYRYARAEGLDEIVGELADALLKRKASLTALIYSGTKDDIRLFSDAFRIKREDD